MSSYIQRSLSGGEIDPVLWGRSDVTKWQTGLRILRNAYVRRNGGVTAKPGSSNVATTKTAGKKVRLIPFIFNQSVTYTLEFGDKYIRFYQNGQPVLAKGMQAYSGATPYFSGQVVTYSGTNYLCVFNTNSAAPWKPGNDLRPIGVPIAYNSNYGVLNITPGTNAAIWYAMPASGVLEIPTLWAVADLPNLRFDQTANDITITHNSYGVMKLSRVPTVQPDTTTQDSFFVFARVPGSYQEPVFVSNNGANPNSTAPAAATTVYGVAPVGPTGDVRAVPTLLSGLPDFSLWTYADFTTTSSTPSGGSPITISWSPVWGTNNAVSYKIYKYNSATGVFGFIGETSQVSFVDNGITPDFSNPWIQASYDGFFSGWGHYYDVSVMPTQANDGNAPLCCAYYQQRLFLGNSNNNPTEVAGSQTGLYDNQNISVPSVATDALSFKMAGSQDVIQHLLSLGTLLVFTYGTINSVPGDASGAISPSSCGPHRESAHGASSLRPLIVGEFALYGQSQGSAIRDLGFNFQVDGYRGDDLTVFATHLFDSYTITDWAYQSVPHSVVWAVRSDGTLLSLTYVREQQILAWAHHDTPGGTYENVCCIPEGNQVSVYVVVNRGGTRYVERFANQQFTDVRNYIGMDCATTIDGRNTTADTVTLSGGTLWNEQELLTATLSANNFLTFSAGMATNNDMIFVYDASGNLYRFKITAYTSATIVQGFLDRQLPVSLQAAATASWSHASKVLSGLSYLNGNNVAVFADGSVVGSPNNPNYPVYAVSGGSVTLDQPYAVVQVGLPFISDIETLDLDLPSAFNNLGPYHKVVGEVTLYLVNSYSLWIGARNPDTDLLNPPGANYSAVHQLVEEKIRQYGPVGTNQYDNANQLKTGKVTQAIIPESNQEGHVFIRNVDPTPFTVAAISPEGLYPMRTG